MAVDMDALAADLIAAGVHGYPSPDRTQLMASEHGTLIYWVYADGNAEIGGEPINWHALDIIRRHVSPEPSRRAAVDTAAVIKLVHQYAADCANAAVCYRHQKDREADAHSDKAHERLAAIRAMLEPHDAARLRETIAEIIARKAFRWNESVVGIPYRSMSEEDRCKDIADAVIRAIGGER